MPHYYIRQPNNKIALWSTISDGFIYENLTEKQFYKLWCDRNGKNETFEEALNYVDKFDSYQNIIDFLNNREEEIKEEDENMKSESIQEYLVVKNKLYAGKDEDLILIMSLDDYKLISLNVDSLVFGLKIICSLYYPTGNFYLMTVADAKVPIVYPESWINKICGAI